MSFSTSLLKAFTALTRVGTLLHIRACSAKEARVSRDHVTACWASLRELVAIRLNLSRPVLAPNKFVRKETAAVISGSPCAHAPWAVCQKLDACDHPFVPSAWRASSLALSHFSFFVSSMNWLFAFRRINAISELSLLTALERVLFRDQRVAAGARRATCSQESNTD